MNMKKVIAIFFLIVFCVAIVMLGFFVLRSGNTDVPGTAVWDVSASAPQPTDSAPPSGYTEYKNTEYKFSLFYPPELEVREYEEAGGAHTTTFEDVTGKKGFQVFITPYSESEITPERFRMDVPSGVMKEPTDIYIDSARATIFFSENALMGETREVWFINNGFLYEVVTYKTLDTWLSEIIRTWKFI